VTDGTGTHATFTEGVGGRSLRPAADGSGFETPDGAGGWIPAVPTWTGGGVIGGILSNLGKTVDAAGGVVLAPGSVVPAGGALKYNPDGPDIVVASGAVVPSSTTSVLSTNKASREGLLINGDGSVTDAAGEDWYAYADSTWHRVADGTVGVPAYGGTDGGILRNARKTLDKTTGAVLEPGTTVPAGGADYYDADPPTVLASGATVPASLATDVDGLMADKPLVYSDGSIPAGNTITGTGATDFASTYSIPANTLRVGTVIEIHASGIFSTTTPPGTLTLGIKIGSVVLNGTGAFALGAALTNLAWSFVGRFVVTAIGASGFVEPSGQAMVATSTTTADVAVVSATSAVSVDTTVVEVVAVNANFSAAGNSIKMRTLDVMIHQPA